MSHGHHHRPNADTSNACLQIGKSKWKKILEAGEGIFQNRSQVDLKDKWRNLERQGIVAAPPPRLPEGGAQPLALAPPPGQQVTTSVLSDHSWEGMVMDEIQP